MNKKQKIILTIKPWQCLLLSVTFSEILTSLMALILTGRVSPDYLITGFVVSLIVASIVVYVLNRARVEERANVLMQEAYQSLEQKVDARTSDLVRANEKLQVEISERIKAREVIKDSEKRYRDLFDSISDLIMVHDLKGRLLNVNPAVSRLSGYTRVEMIGRPISDFIAPKFRSRFQGEYLSQFKKQNQSEGVAVFQAKDGTEHYVEYRNSLTNREGTEPYISGTGRDITAQLQAKKALEKAKQEAEAANRAKSEFLANISHELRTPLNHIIGFTELVVDRKFGELNAAQQEYLGDVLTSSRHLLSLINDILDLSKVEAGKLELKMSDVNLKLLLENSLVMIKEKAAQRGIRLSTDLDGVPETIRADERIVKQILYNLLSNAVKFTPEGGSINLAACHLSMVNGHLTAQDSRAIDPPITNDPSPSADDREPIAEGNFVEISVTDSGIGLDQENIEYIFSPFEQVERSASRRYQGTGLGLSLTKSFVEMHDGKIWAASEGRGKGSTFRFILPA